LINSEIDPPPTLNANLIPIEGSVGGKIKENNSKKKDRRHKKLQKGKKKVKI